MAIDNMFPTCSDGPMSPQGPEQDAAPDARVDGHHGRGTQRALPGEGRVDESKGQQISHL